MSVCSIPCSSIVFFFFPWPDAFVKQVQLLLSSIENHELLCGQAGDFDTLYDCPHILVSIPDTCLEPTDHDK